MYLLKIENKENKEDVVKVKLESYSAVIRFLEIHKKTIDKSNLYMVKKQKK